MKRLLPLCLAAVASTAFAQPYVNGPFVTHPGAFACVAPIPPGDGSSLENIAPLNLNTFGFTASNAFRCADDFTVPAGESWTLSDITVYGYQTLTSNAVTSTITAGNYRIWCGTPGAGGTIVADFSAASQWMSSTWTGAYRATAGVIGVCAAANTNRKIMDVVMNGNGIVLGPGTYWVDYALTAPAGPFCPPIAILGTGNTGNARQLNVGTNTWVNLTTGAALFPQGLPFRLNYTVGASAGAQFQTNSPENSIDFDGATANACGSAAISRPCVGSMTSFNFSSSVAVPWELAYSVLPAVSLAGGGIATANGQVVNINLLDPFLGFLNNLSLPPYGFPLGPNPGTFQFPAPPLVDLTVQAVAFGPIHPDGFVLSQAAQLSPAPATPLVFPIAPALTDESFVSVNLDGPPNCAGFGLPFFGTVRSVMHVTSNGQVIFDATAVNDFSPTVAEAQTRAMVCVWEDLNPATVGSGGVTITNPAPGQISVNYNGVWRFTTGSATNMVTCSFLFDQNGNIDMLGLGGILPTPAAAAQFLGISAGNGAAAGASTTFAPGPVACPAGTMLYQFTTGVPIATPGVGQISLIPDGLNGYTGNAL